MPDTFPEDLRRFIAEYISSVEQLEVLLLLKNRADRDWSAEEISQALSSQPSAIRMRLNDLTSHGLLQQKMGAERFRYQPATPELDRLTVQLAEAYHLRRVSIITLIYSTPRTQVQAFADAFRLRKDK
jgi:predicted ArsR family transcriptional regulator